MRTSLLVLVALLAMPAAFAYHTYGYGYDAGYGSRYERVVDDSYFRSTESEYSVTNDYYGGYYRGARSYNYGRSRSVDYGRRYERESRDVYGGSAYAPYWYDGDRYGYVPYGYGYSVAYPMYGYGFYR